MLPLSSLSHQASPDPGGREEGVRERRKLREKESRLLARWAAGKGVRVAWMVGSGAEIEITGERSWSG